MAEPMTVEVEVWPVSADQSRIWLLSGDGPWPSPPVLADSEPHEAVELELIQHSVSLDDVALLHSTSWRTKGTAVFLSYIAVVRCPDLVLAAYPDARPVSLRLAEHVGRPPTHAATEPPAPRDVDVLIHALRHLRLLLDFDATSARALDGEMRRHLAMLEPALACMYDQPHQPARGV